MAIEEITTQPDYLGRRSRTHLAWDKLEKGDEVAFLCDTQSWNGASVKMYIVDRLTATQVIMTDGSRWYRKNGQQVASSDSSSLLHPLDDQVVNTRLEMEHRAFKRALEELAKQKTSSQFNMLMAHRLGVESLTRRFGARVRQLEALRRGPDAH